MRQSNGLVWGVVFALTFAPGCRTERSGSERGRSDADARSARTPTPAAGQGGSAPSDSRRSGAGGTRVTALPSASHPEVSAKSETPDSGLPSAWVSCAKGFEPAATSKLTAARLGMACGPSNGMIQHAVPSTGRIGEDDEVGERAWFAVAGSCFRLVAAATGVADLELEIFGPDGEAVALENSDSLWLLAPGRGPLCVDADGRYRAVVRTHGGRGRYALEIWRIH